MRRVRAALALVLALAGPVAAQTQAPPQQLPILIVDYDRLYQDSAFADTIRDQLDRDAEALKAENDRIVAALTEEERSLTLRRPSMTAEAFREEATAFDTKVQAIRRARDAKEVELQQARVAAREGFYTSVRDVIGQLMLERGASVILDRRSVFLALAASDITDEAIARIDETMLDPDDPAPDAATPLISGSPEGEDEAGPVQPEPAEAPQLDP
ncbi:OmpH family outer membrane protein [Salipiger sp. IMCC34102]|uniref:OmpH family outer membrane protein n=1 Tax=Salipiger sp. IMCC34102 TaxID=2510647 RepID=UPI00101DCD4E|nr:OmpH family outer membrane protein [Salipiger sp. IMCC34102]RYH03420.1 OmpH family outer membrane protein [Salipiger sp. IMCC34102]